MSSDWSFRRRSDAGAFTTATCPTWSYFPRTFGANTVRFSAGLELNLLNYLLIGCAPSVPLVRAGLYAPCALLLESLADALSLGDDQRSAGDLVEGTRSYAGERIERRIALVTDYDGPATPSSAAVVLARKILMNGPPRTGAFPAVGLVSLHELLAHLHPLGIWCARGDHSGWSTRRGSSQETI